MSAAEVFTRLLVLDIGAMLLFVVVYGVVVWRMWRGPRPGVFDMVYDLLDTKEEQGRPEGTID